MKIQLVQAEIEEALHDYIQKQGISLKGKTMSIAFTAGRGNNGMTADLDIEPVRDMLPGVLARGNISMQPAPIVPLNASTNVPVEVAEQEESSQQTIAGEDLEKAAAEAAPPEGKKESASLFG